MLRQGLKENLALLRKVLIKERKMLAFAAGLIRRLQKYADNAGEIRWLKKISSV
jgi:hypothetical protein